MAVAGVIAEYNPFHRGHGWQISEIRRRLGADTAVVACMSGNFVQRGDFAILNKHSRAEMALAGGVDLVLELPSPWSAAAAERFAQGGVAVLAATGVVTHLAFGCESGDLEPLQAVAECLDSGVYHAGVTRFTGEGMTFAAARQAVVWALLERQGNGGAAECLSSPNNALAVEYLRALKARDSGIEPLALPRVGAAHDSGEESGYPSASAIRERLLAGGDWRGMLPESSEKILSREIEAGRAPVSMDNCQRAVLAQLRRMNEEDFRVYDGGNEGLYHRFYDAVHAAACLTDILQAAKTKRYPMARLRRMLLQAYLGVPQAAQGETPPYIRVLGANGRGKALLGQMRKSASLPVVTKPGHVRRLDRAVQRSFDQEARCTDLYVLAYPELRQSGPGSDYASGPVLRMESVL
ncbi:MAG: nucleotidyltransferase family protein [Oscillospiraceae bacterium]|nr:nucleotidyltransferase family protein [Oscillospiraceae bacterium]